MVETHLPQRIAHLTPLSAVLTLIEENVQPVAPETVPVAVARGLTLAEPVKATAGRPAAAVALRDGWAVTAAATSDAGIHAPVPLPAAQRIDAGAPLPPGADAVAPLEAVAGEAGAAQAIMAVAPGEGVLAAGEDVAAGVTLVAAGRRLGATELGLLQALDVEAVSVRRPRIRIVATRTGDQLIGAAVRMLHGAVCEAGCDASTLVANPDHLRDAVGDTEGDGVIVVGGTGVGRNDSSVQALARVGRVAVHGIALAPGESAALGFVSGEPVLCVPGRLDAALSVWLMLGQPLLRRLRSGADEIMPAAVVPLARKAVSLLGVTELIPVRLREGKAEPLATDYWSLSVLAEADGYVVAGSGSEGFAAGTPVPVLPLP